MSGSWRWIAVAIFFGTLLSAAAPDSAFAFPRALESDAMDPSLIGSIVLGAIGVLIFAGLFVTRTKSKRRVYHRAERPLAPLVVPTRSTHPPDPRWVRVPGPEHAGAGGTPWMGPPGQPEPAASGGDAFIEGRTVRFSRIAEGTLQLLPGRLEVVEGEDRGRDVRFVRPREGVPEITFGRSEGSPHRHVQLLSRTVSREHARMRFEDGRWIITNLSRTNPVVVNGEELPAETDSRELRDGDRIEMGEVVFRFHAR